MGGVVNTSRSSRSNSTASLASDESDVTIKNECNIIDTDVFLTTTIIQQKQEEQQEYGDGGIDYELRERRRKENSKIVGQFKTAAYQPRCNGISASP